jgi:homocysteine S-methyltransferase
VDTRAASVSERPDAKPPVPRERKSRFAARLAAGEFVIGVDLLPPRGLACAEVIDTAKALAAHNVDVVTVLDAPRAGARMSALSLAVLVQQQAGVETLLQYSCRDKNLLGIQSDLLGAYAMGLRNLLGITGDVRKLGDIPDATAVFDVDSVGLTNVLTRLNHGLDVGGQPIGQPTAFHVGVMVNPAADDLDGELRRFEYKLEAGAEFAITHPVFDAGSLERFLERAARLRLPDIPVLATLYPFDSVLNAEFMANEVPGIRVPAAVMERMRSADTDARAAAEGVRLAQELAGVLRRMVQGLHISAPPGHPELALQTVEGVRKP